MLFQHLKVGKLSWYAIVAMLGAAALYLVARANYLLYHALVELFSVVVAGMIFTISYVTRQHEGNLFPFVLGIGYLFTGFLDLLHTIAYKGMGIFAATGANLATELWIGGRYLEAVVLLTAPLVRSGRWWPVMVGLYTIYSIFLLLSVFEWDNFPRCYIEGVGLTAYKIFSEYVIILLLVVALYTFRRSRSYLPSVLVRFIPYSILTTIISELCFTLYVNVYDLANFVGHLFKLLSYSIAFYGIVIHCIREPLDNLYRSLCQDRLRFQNLAITDPLTGLMNRRGIELVLRDLWQQVQVKGLALGLVLVDVDHFKRVNDSYGHKVGDIVLRELARLILSNLRNGQDVAGRYGGEEFLVAIVGGDARTVISTVERLRKKVKEYDFATSSGKGIRITISAGIAMSGDYQSLEEALENADRALYRAKELGRDRTEVA